MYRLLDSLSFKLTISSLFIALLSGCGNGTLPDSSVSNNPVDEKSVALAKPGELLSFYKAVLRKRAERNEAMGLMAPLPTAVASPASGGDAAPPAANISGTNVQEAGVDEDDLIKTDGNRIFTLVRDINSTNGSQTNRLVGHTRSANGIAVQDGQLTLLSGSYDIQGMQYAKEANTVAIIGSQYKQITNGTSPSVSLPGANSPSISPYFGYAQTSIEIVGGQTALPKKQTLVIDGAFLATRLIGNTLYVASTWQPRVAADVLPATTSAADRSKAIDALTASEILPTISVDGGVATALLAETDCFLQTKNASTQLALTTIVAIELNSSSLKRTVRCLLGGQEAFYMTPQSVYFATARWEYPVVNGAAQTTVLPPNIFTDIHKFNLADNTINYRGSGSVDGHLGWNKEQKSYRFSEFEGALRVVTFTGSQGWVLPAVTATNLPTTAASPATITILKEGLDSNSKAALLTQAKLPNSSRPLPIGKPNEQIFAVRFQGTKAYVVTFRQTDPLYVIDLSSNTDPKLAGELNITGFSDYLVPLSNNLLFGIGKDADVNGVLGGVKIALFDIANPAQPREVASRVFGDRWSSSAQDYSSHGVNILTVGNQARIALPVRLTKTAANGTVINESQALRRLEINTANKSLTEKTPAGNVLFNDLPSGAIWGSHDISRERSLQIDGSIYYLSGGRLATYSW